jgi:CheY-like chemotaxis protein
METLAASPAGRQEEEIQSQQKLLPGRSTVTSQTSLPDASSAPAKMKILLVEDNVVNQKVTLKQLENLGYAADIAANGQEALQMMAQFSYDLVLMDCQMPVLDGYSATQKIRRLEGDTRHTVIIALTANAMKEDRQRCLDAGMDDYLSKPILKEQLAVKLSEWGRAILESQPAASSHRLSNMQFHPPQSSRSLPPEPEIDWNHLHQISDGSKEFELELLQAFVEDTQIHLKNIEDAIATQNLNKLEQAAHHIKGASANVGLIKMQAAAGKLEQQSRHQQLEGALDLLKELQRSLIQLQSFLAAKLTSEK